MAGTMTKTISWENRKAGNQMFGIVRHAERADSIYGFLDGGRWTQTEDYARWPQDPPLSDEGVSNAHEVAADILAYAQKHDSQFHVIVSSPYCRCLQTALAIREALGTTTRLLVDASLGEIYGPTVMTDPQGGSVVRFQGHQEELPKATKIALPERVGIVGEWPKWPETLQAARKRYSDRFLTYLKRGSHTKRNFLLVTHADCVGACLHLMPSHSTTRVETIDFAGYFLAGRTLKDEQRAGTDVNNKSEFSSEADTVFGNDDAGEDHNTALVKKDNSKPEALAAPAQDDGWIINTSGINFFKVTAPLAKLSRMSQVMHLLDNFAELPLRGANERLVSLSDSTAIFGQSDSFSESTCKNNRGEKKNKEAEEEKGAHKKTREDKEARGCRPSARQKARAWLNMVSVDMTPQKNINMEKEQPSPFHLAGVNGIEQSSLMKRRNSKCVGKISL
eukprot:TRINITY_DN7173_c0_g1_i1.p1 TRINITY_DN7173_c0_g1~~TRINITY_DN7173_c0_g1_i1.p1  ORF type:complete len:449 (-),score=54.87 TRINITY_DN7173_c0_g1_i1:54-1400(-)